MESISSATTNLGRSQSCVKVGLPAVDEQHETLINELNCLIVDTAAGTRSALFSEVLSRLGREMREHFSFEEEQFARLGMPADSIAQHVAAHQAILVDYTELNMDLMDHHPVVRSEVLFRMERWIQDHIMEYDLKLRDYLPSRPLLAP